MPTLRLASAPKIRPTATVIASASRTPHHGFQPRFSPFVLPFVVALPSTKPATPNIAHLRERDHAAVGLQEDQARGDDAEEHHLREQRVDPVGRQVERRQQRQQDPEHTDDAVRRDPHSGLPNRPSGRTASTIATSTNVKMIE